MSPWRLPGEPNRASAVWLAAGDQTSLGGVSRLFSRSSLITNKIYNILGGKLQEKNPDLAESEQKKQGLFRSPEFGERMGNSGAEGKRGEFFMQKMTRQM